MMDAPTPEILRDWFLAGLALLWGAAALAAGAAGVVGRRSGRPFVDRFRLWWPPLAFVAGAAGTTALGHAAGAFLFTWPVALHAAVWATARLALRPGAKRTDDAAVVALAGLFALYYWVCRRLGLAFEWAFLAGPPAAIPFAMLARRRPGEGPAAAAREVVCGTLGFAASYAVGCGLLWYRYG